ncbi:MAG: hypothetical protein US94_C0043G0003 [Berkelbacteria bacterium GW2011_GWB1_38_5]|uniref:Uncharacterized protein n=1 Tax=Berkelbacteria bacterium GW2011_GWB1_38_5 TaxID=1618336 RepID=A0A0G0JY46_9BACT|nr:MAG: hypothetical protein US94_C0043G0003 [Berkelbacteria bacterium GW2011_GWB1_38_5]
MRQNYFAVLLMLAVAIVVAILVVEQRAATVMGEDWVNLTHLDIEQKFLHLMAHDVVTRTIVVVMLVLVALAFGIRAVSKVVRRRRRNTFSF